MFLCFYVVKKSPHPLDFLILKAFHQDCCTELHELARIGFEMPVGLEQKANEGYSVLA
jgi:hypothetical protein